MYEIVCKAKNKLPQGAYLMLEDMESLGIIYGETEADEISEIISDYLSDTYGFCVFGFQYEVEPDHINIYKIEWDCQED